MRPISFIALCFVALLLGTTACSHSGAKNASENIGDITDGCHVDTTVCFQAFTMTEKFIFSANWEDVVGQEFLMKDSVKIALPSKCKHACQLAQLRDSIISLAFDTVGARCPARAAEAYFMRYNKDSGYSFRTVCDDYQNKDQYAEGYVTITGGVVSQTDKYLSYFLSNASYLVPAAHGIYDFYYINCAMPSGEIVSLSDLVNPEGMKALPTIIQKAGGDRVMFTNDDGTIELPSGNNFYLTDAGRMVFVYQIYEIAPYSEGAVDIAVNPKDISRYLTPLGRSLLLPEGD